MATRKRQAAINIAALFLLLDGCAADEEVILTEKRIEQASATVSNQPDNKQSSKKGIMPVQIVVPSLDIEANVESVGLTDDGTMELPSDDKLTAWYENGALPGENGNSVIAGHVDNKTGPAVFFRLKDIKPGEEVIVYGKNGEELTFVVQDKKAYPFDDAPLPSIFGFSQEKKLNLITCTGTFDLKKKTHLERLVVSTKLKEPS
ncbi:class F sortase [Peribacillus frigoritolerans]|uniref:class F sortase n=1 Tax=Peribacillus frigoritolerans TaxID=450367 RepID=UPI00105A7330|nr:class F sortase [Peribacillus frigoritolerans]TDL82704.1 class F sortase [Peribacillus frigoritolerans]